MCVIVAMFLILSGPASAGAERADRVLVKKSEAKLYIVRDGHAFAEFHVAFGSNPVGAKQRQGDGRTPEGRYILDARNEHSAYHKALHVSYPNAEDRERARRIGVSSGGDIMVHGQPNGWGAFAATTQRSNWTLGCIALADEDMDVVWSSVPVGTPIDIEP
jgi:murein L,D-transpeptidase YafK